MRPTRIILFVALFTANLVAALPAAAGPFGQERQAIITSPRDGAQLTGVVQITGTASDSQFDHYELAWAPQSAPDNWQTIANVQNQVVNGSLGAWETSQLQPGVYMLRLRVVRGEDRFVETFVRDLSVNQGTPTPTATRTAPVGPTIPPPPSSGTAAATPTVVIAQPPTSTPQVATTKPGAASVSTPGSARPSGIQFNLASFQEATQQAFCSGVLYTLLIFLVWGIVVGAREIVRWVWRRMCTPTLPKN